MQFEQISIDHHFDQPLQIRYNTLDNNKRIYCKIDWLTVIFENCSLNHVLRWLKLEDAVSDFCAAAYEQSRGFDNVFKFAYNGIILETSSFNFYGVDLTVSIFDTIVPRIRLELSGSALDYLRSMGLDMDQYRFTAPVLPLCGSYHFTRADFAYDFVNYMPEFVDQMLDHVYTNMLPSGRVPLASTKGAIGCRVITGGQKTIYLGSPQADKMLRVYDKKMQYVDLTSGLYKKQNPFDDPESWFRIEWQIRNKLAHNLVLDSSQDFKSILRLIFNNYAFAKGNHDINHAGPRPVVDFWLKLFNWKEVETRIIQNANYVQCESPEEKLCKSFESVMIRSFILWFSLLGREEAEKRCNAYLKSLYLPDPVSDRRKIAFINKLNQLKSFELPCNSADSSGGLWRFSDRLFFKF